VRRQVALFGNGSRTS